MPRGLPPPSSEDVRRRMQATGRRDTAPELALRAFLSALGADFEVDQAPLDGLSRRADILFRSARVAVYVDGCFWHGCPQHATWPKANAVFWRAKIEANRARDADTDRRLQEAGWRVLRFWEHVPAGEAASTTAAAVGIRASRAKRSQVSDAR